MIENSGHGFSEGGDSARYIPTTESRKVEASLREKLKEANEEIQQLKEALGWMVPIAEKHLNCIGDMDADYGGYEFEIEVSRKLLIVLNKPEG